MDAPNVLDIVLDIPLSRNLMLSLLLSHIKIITNVRTINNLSRSCRSHKMDQNHNRRWLRFLGKDYVNHILVQTNVYWPCHLNSTINIRYIWHNIHITNLLDKSRKEESRGLTECSDVDLLTDQYIKINLIDIKQDGNQCSLLPCKHIIWPSRTQYKSHHDQLKFFYNMQRYLLYLLLSVYPEGIITQVRNLGD